MGLRCSWDLFAGVQGCGYCSTAISMVDSLWQSNMALYGGALYVDEGCSLTVHNTTFSSNYAQVPRPVRHCMDAWWQHLESLLQKLHTTASAALLPDALCWETSEVTAALTLDTLMHMTVHAGKWRRDHCRRWRQCDLRPVYVPRQRGAAVRRGRSYPRTRRYPQWNVLRRISIAADTSCDR